MVSRYAPLLLFKIILIKGVNTASTKATSVEKYAINSGKSSVKNHKEVCFNLDIYNNFVKKLTFW